MSEETAQYKRRKPKHEESALQKTCVKWFRYAYPQFKGCLFAIPNGGKRGVIEASIMKSEGVLAGVSDLQLMIPRKEFHAFFIEMKTAKGKQSDNQKIFEQECIKHGYKYMIVNSFEMFVQVIENYLK